MNDENISASEKAKKAIEDGCPRCEQSTHYITSIITQRILVHTEGVLHFSVDSRCRTPNDGSVVYVECETCGFIIYEHKPTEHFPNYKE